MAAIKAFKCIRPQKELAHKIAALPYDVYTRDEALEEVIREPMSFLKIDRAETQLSSDIDMYDERVYKKAHELLWGMVDEGSFIKDETEGYYIYELIMNNRSQTGIAACASIDDYNNNIIKKHENTRADKEIDRIKHVDICNAQTGPIFLAYRSNEIINDIVNAKKKEKPLYSFVSNDGIHHNVWKIDSEKNIDAIKKAFEAIQDIYIADGHHRAASAVKVGLKRREENPLYTGEEEFNFFLSVLFPDDQLMIMPYNRAVKDLNNHVKEEFLELIGSSFTVEELGAESFSPDKKGVFGMYLEGEWYKLTVKKELLGSEIVDDPVKSLDVSILQDKILKPVLNIEDPRTDKRIDFIGGIRGLKELERRADSDMMAAFSMYPTSIEELFKVADADRLMPPKSTWFEPKLRSGLFIHALN